MCSTWVPTCTSYENKTIGLCLSVYLSHFKWVKKSTNSITHDSQACALHHSTAATACFYSVDDGKSKLWNIKMLVSCSIYFETFHEFSWSLAEVMKNSSFIKCFLISFKKKMFLHPNLNCSNVCIISVEVIKVCT